jgi:hypothetical protein
MTRINSWELFASASIVGIATCGEAATAIRTKRLFRMDREARF